jgi:hypothetical protein
MVLSLDIGRIKRESYRIVRQDGLSGILIPVGLLQLARFCYKYPKTTKETHHGDL